MRPQVPSLPRSGWENFVCAAMEAALPSLKLEPPVAQLARALSAPLGAETPSMLTSEMVGDAGGARGIGWTLTGPE